jgi:hypothetical protein
MIVALSKENLFAEERFQFDAFEKEVQQIDATEVGDVLSGERDFQIFGSKWHRNVT